MEFKSKVALVTGAGMGIGRATALRLAGKGATVVVSDINEKAGLETTASIQSEGGTASFHLCDVSDAEQVKQLFDYTISTYGQLDILVNNAGVGSFLHKKTAEVTLEEYHRVIAVNQNGVFYCMQEGLRTMLENGGGGRIVNIASLAGLTGVANACVYANVKTRSSWSYPLGSNRVRPSKYPGQCRLPRYNKNQNGDGLFGSIRRSRGRKNKERNPPAAVGRN